MMCIWCVVWKACMLVHDVGSSACRVEKLSTPQFKNNSFITKRGVVGCKCNNKSNFILRSLLWGQKGGSIFSILWMLIKYIHLFVPCGSSSTNMKMLKHIHSSFSGILMFTTNAVITLSIRAFSAVPRNSLPLLRPSSYFALSLSVM